MVHKEKKSLLKGIVIFLVVFLKMLTLIPGTKWGVDFDELSVLLSVERQSLFCLIILFSVLVATVFASLIDKSGKLFNCVCAWLALDVVFILLQDNHIELIISILGLLVALLVIKGKTIIKDEILICVFLFVASLLNPSYIFSCIPFAIGVYWLWKTSVTPSNNSNKIIMVGMVLCSLAGAVISSLAISPMSADERILISDIEFVDLLKIFVLFLPNIIASILFIRYRLKNSEKGVRFTAKLKGGLGQSIVFVVLMYLLGLTGCLIVGLESVCCLNLVSPVALYFFARKSGIEKQLTSQIEMMLDKWLWAILVVAIIWTWFSIKVFDFATVQRVYDILINSFEM